MATTPAPLAVGGPVSGLYKFVRDHLLIANNVVLASTTLVGALDFLSPRFTILPRVVYSVTVVLALLILASGLWPALVARTLASAGREATRDDLIPLWRRPAWQFALTILIGVSILGWTGVVRAGDRGWLASNIPAARSAQDSLLSMSAAVADIKGGVTSANTKIDKVIAAIDPANAASRCPDVWCAVLRGGDAETVGKLFEKGATLPNDDGKLGSIVNSLAVSEKPGRLAVLDVLFAHGLDPNKLLMAGVHDEAALNDPARAIARTGMAISRLGERPGVRGQHVFENLDVNAWNQVAVCLFSTSGGVSLVELAAMRGDAELYRHMIAKGVTLPTRPLRCKWGSQRMGGGALIAIADGAARVEPLR